MSKTSRWTHYDVKIDCKTIDVCSHNRLEIATNAILGICIAGSKAAEQIQEIKIIDRRESIENAWLSGSINSEDSKEHSGQQAKLSEQL